jgi:hypothetical protein
VARSVKAQLLESELMNSTPEHVHAWLKNRAEEPDDRTEYGDDEIEEALLTRNSPLIELGLARYGFSAKVINRLFTGSLRASPKEIRIVGSSEREIPNTPKLLRLAVLSNRRSYRFPKALCGLDAMREFLDSCDSDEMETVFRNPSIDEELLGSLYAKERPFDCLDDEKWRRFIIASIHNPRLRKDYTGPMDGWTEYLHRRVSDQAWKLAESVPRTKDWAEVLSPLLETIKPYSSSIKNPMSIIPRWRVETTSGHGLEGSSEGNGEPAENGDLDDFGTIGYLDDFGMIRLDLTRLMSTEAVNSLRTNEDIALRCAFYRFGRPTASEMQEAYERERKFFLNTALFNEAVWQKRETRELLHDLCWEDKGDSDPLHYPNYYRERHTRVSTDHPEWFGDETPEENGSSSNRTDPIDSILVRQMDLQNQITGLNSKLAAVLWIVIAMFLVMLVRRF